VVCWVVVPRNLLAVFQRFEGTCCFHLQGLSEEGYEVTVVGANLCSRDPLKAKGKAIRGVGEVADKEACTVHTLTLFPSGSNLYLVV
jgi:hypothetical protein